MNSKAWIELIDSEYNEVWDRFYSQFQFNPSVKKESWPGIKEPLPSLTYNISAIYNMSEQEAELKNSNLMNSVLNIFKKLTSAREWIYALDWKHSCYKFYPHVSFDLNEFGEWTIPILPNGDYYIFLEKDFKYGIFGHPWEMSMCFFGVDLLNELKIIKPELLKNLIRAK